MFPYTKRIPVLAEAEVVVVGAGSAGSVAALAAAATLARMGSPARVLLIERYGFAGGTSTQVLDTFYGFYTPGSRSKKVVGGIPDRVIDRLARLDRVIERPNTFGAGTGVTYNPEVLKIAWEQLLLEAGVQPLYHSFVTDAIMEGDRVAGVVVDGKSGLGVIRGGIFVDASGDADVCARAGVAFERAGEIEPAQTLTTTFRLANVDIARARGIPRSEFLAKLSECAQSGQYDLPRREGSAHITPVDGVMATIMTRVAAGGATDPTELTKAEIEGRRQAMEYQRFLREQIPGYERAGLSFLSTQIGVRETRRVYGEYRLSREDVLSARKFPDVVGLCGAPIEDHHSGRDTNWAYLPDGETVDIPFRCLLPLGAEGLVVAGRCFSATHDAHASVRSMAQCMAMGQAAGCAAALCAVEKTAPRLLPAPRLQDELRRLGAILESPATA
ncbi:MAG: FAD-dependent oxidoreductase [Bryobacterales bacterium]|nr:FAD-dependent oxidoreductase [Bryobacterales bacterium]